jgi:hypothetical protein
LFSGSPNLESVLAFTQNAHAARNLPVGVSHTINFVSLGGRTLTGAPANTLSLAQVVIEVNYVGDRKPAGNVLNLVQTVTTLSDISVTHDLGLTDVAVGQGPIKPDLTSFLGLSQHVSTPYHMWVSHDLGIADFLNTPLPLQVVTHTLNFVSESPIGGITSTLNLSDSATYAFSLTAANLMTLVDVMSVEGIWIRNVSQVLGIGHSLTWYEDTPCGRKQYTPFQGETTVPDAPAQPANVLQDPQGSISDRFALYQPALGSRTSEVILRAPEMDNRDRNAYNRVNRETRGGKLVVFADPIWPKVRTLAVTMVGLTETQIDELQTFLQATVGQEIGITDWEGRLWSGVIVDPDEVATQDSKGERGWTVSFQFEGEMLTTEQPGNDDGDGMSMNLTHSATAVIV